MLQRLRKYSAEAKKPSFFDRIEQNFESKRLAKQQEALKKARVSQAQIEQADAFFSTTKNMEARKILMKEAFQKGYYDDAKVVAKKGAKLWEAGESLRIRQKSPNMLGLKDFKELLTVDGEKLDLDSYLMQRQVCSGRLLMFQGTLVGFFFNQFGRDNIKTFVDEYQKEFQDDKDMGCLEFNVVEQGVKSPLIKFLTPYIRWKMPANSRFV